MGIKRTVSALMLGGLAIGTPISWAEDVGQSIAMQGNSQGAMACVSCHGMQGEGQAAAGFPRLAGLSKKYLISQLQAFANGQRQNMIMQPNASTLSNDEQAAVAGYFAQLPITATASADSTDSALLKQGEALASNGNWDNNVPACFACHGPMAAGVGDNFPTLAGQSALYISNQLNAWKNGQRNNDPNQLMKSVADKLTDNEIAAVSAYLASLPITK